jgi:hypothetical protein
MPIIYQVFDLDDCQYYIITRAALCTAVPLTAADQPRRSNITMSLYTHLLHDV